MLTGYHEVSDIIFCALPAAVPRFKDMFYEILKDEILHKQ